MSYGLLMLPGRAGRRPGAVGLSSPALLQRGVSLVEVAMVLVIVGLLLGGLLGPLTLRLALQQERDTADQLLELRQSLQAYAVVHGRLPCPARADLSSDVPAAGTEDCSQASAQGVRHGVLPWATLGVVQLDPWGRRWSYQVDERFARPLLPGAVDPQYACPVAPSPAPVHAVFGLCAQGRLQVRGAPTMGWLAEQVPAVLVSHGANGHGAWLPSGARMPLPVGDEAENADGSANTLFVWHERREPGAPGGAFDDQVQWLPGVLLMGMMVQAGRLPY